MFNCPTCSSTYISFKSLHRHKTVKHPETIIPNAERVAKRMAEYDLSPTRCRGCGLTLTYNQRRNTFCTQSCSAKFNNTQRDQVEINNRVRNTWRTKLGQLSCDKPKQPAKWAPYVPVVRTQKLCITCKCSFIGSDKKIYCDITCNTTKSGKVRYRSLCKFNLNSKDNYALYNFQLIKTNGWYTPANKGIYNPDGVTWDHLYRIEDGFKNNVSPTIMSHPANAEMVTWRENINRKVSQITLPQLLERIVRWDSEILRGPH